MVIAGDRHNVLLAWVRAAAGVVTPRLLAFQSSLPADHAALSKRPQRSPRNTAALAELGIGHISGVHQLVEAAATHAEVFGCFTHVGESVFDKRIAFAVFDFGGFHVIILLQKY